LSKIAINYQEKKMMKAIQRIFIVCLVVCTIFLLSSTAFQQIPVALADTSTNSINAYGAEAQIFVTMLLSEFPGLPLALENQSRVLVVISDISLVNIQSVSNSMKNGAILVAINLPEDNGLVDAPRVTFGSKQTIGGWLVLSETLHENVISPYWIVVDKQDIPGFTGQYHGGTADDAKSHETVMQAALYGVHSALFPNDSTHPYRPEVAVDNDHWNVDSRNTVAWSILGVAIVVGAVVLIATILTVIGIVVLVIAKRTKR
jgi:hypothetical protein